MQHQKKEKMNTHDDLILFLEKSKEFLSEENTPTAPSLVLKIYEVLNVVQKTIIDLKENEKSSFSKVITIFTNRKVLILKNNYSDYNKKVYMLELYTEKERTLFRAFEEESLRDDAFEKCNTDKGIMDVFYIPGEWYSDRLNNLGHTLYGDLRNIK